MNFSGNAIIRLVSLLSLAFCSSPAFAEDGWSLSQIAKGGAALNGGMTLYITKTGMRTVDQKNGISLMTRGPNWTIYIFNSKTKRMFASALQPWLASFKQRNLVGKFEGANWQRGGQSVVAGVPAWEFIMAKPPQVPTNSKVLNSKVRQQAGAIQAANLYVAASIETPRPVSEILSKLYGIPDVQRIPLRVTVVEANKGKSNAVDTTRVAHINVPESVFQVPTGYQMVKQDSDVFIDQESMDTLDEMLQDLDSPAPKRPGVNRPGTTPRR